MPIAGFDHVALPTARPEGMIRFYRALGFDTPDPETWPDLGHTFFSVHLADQKINFHAPALWQNPGFDLRGPSALPGCGDLCFVWEGSEEALRTMLTAADAEIVAGPMEMVGGRAAGRGQGRSVYIRDPDRNLLEFIVYDVGSATKETLEE